MNHDIPISNFEIRSICFTDYCRNTEILAKEIKEPLEKDLKKYILKYEKKNKEIGHIGRALDIISIEINNQNIILKLFKKKTEYLKEKKIYLLLKNEEFLPKLLYFDDKNFILGITDVGECLEVYKKKNYKKYIELLPKINNEIIKITNHLYDNYHLYHNDLREKNICIDSNYIIRLIDFEYASSKLRDGEKKGAFKPYP